jgi:hypothetical protein
MMIPGFAKVTIISVGFVTVESRLEKESFRQAPAAQGVTGYGKRGADRPFAAAK